MPALGLMIERKTAGAGFLLTVGVAVTLRGVPSDEATEPPEDEPIPLLQPEPSPAM